MSASHLSWNLSNALNWNSTASRELLLPLKLREEDGARDPVVGNISLHLFISEHTAQERNHLFHGLNTAFAKELDRLFDARKSRPLSGKVRLSAI